MTTNNAVNTTLSGQSGTGAFAGTNSPTLTSPLLNQILDINSNLNLLITATPSAVNYLAVGNSATGGNVSINTLGGDANINLGVTPKGTGQFVLFSTNPSPFSIGSGTAYQHATIFSFANTSATQTVTFEDATGIIGVQQSANYTPLLKFGGNNTGMTFSTQSGTYTRQGGVCTFVVNLVLTAKGTSTGAATLTLPVAIRSGIPNPTINFTGQTITATGGLTSLGTNGTTTLNLYGFNSGTTLTTLSDTAFANNSQLFISGTYLI